MKAEFVVKNDLLSHLLWTRNFLKQKGYDWYPTFHQANTSEISLETNGTESSIKRTRHSNIRFYFIKYHIIREYLNKTILQR